MTSYRHPLGRAALAVAMTGAALALAACGADDGSSTGHSAHEGSSPSASASAPASGSASRHDAADVSFAKGMIPHHRQAVEMADLAAGRASSAEVKTLASEIKKAQDPEIKTLSGWLTVWGEDVPAKGATVHSGHAMSGMMSGDDMAGLEKASGKAFDTAFLDLMVKHHEGAVAMARTEKAEGAHQGAKDMADDIIASQTAEITRMKTLLGS
ncbi:DUF305 domain-containing protein [Streptomyces sp. NPDC088400]|uniref:DUF305 domain-containing protein n=1 Tax=Streptomyces sp. NPDC088400 TaxID=3365861 RepID=UPI003826B11D